jgi:hypothetical protein
MPRPPCEFQAEYVNGPSVKGVTQHCAVTRGMKFIPSPTFFFSRYVILIVFYDSFQRKYVKLAQCFIVIQTLGIGLQSFQLDIQVIKMSAVVIV